MTVTKNFKAGLRVGALVVLAFVYVSATATTAAVGVLTPDPIGTVWLSIAAFLGLQIFLGYAFRPWGPAFP